MEPWLFDVADAGNFVPTPYAQGPWSPGVLHGGPVGALLARCCRAALPGDGWFPARITIDLVRPVPMAPLSVTTAILREGRKASLVSAECRAEGALVARASLQLIADDAVPVPRDLPARQWSRDAPPPAPETLSEASVGAQIPWVAFHAASVEHRTDVDPLTELGRGTDWIRVRADLFEGEALDPFGRVVCAADLTNAVGASVPFEDFAYPNADVTINVFRLPEDDWVHVDAVMRASDRGVGLAESVLSDRLGIIGHATLSLVIGRREPPARSSS
jgi:hypothetical protein